MRVLLAVFVWILSCIPAQPEGAMSDRVVVATVTRPPFSMVADGQDVGFSLELWAAIADELGVQYDVERYDTFPDMLAAIETGDANIAVANISITSERETRMDFSQPIFSAGVQVMLPPRAGTLALLRSALSPRLLLMVGLALLTLLLLGMAMWWAERHHRPWGDRPRDAAFPAFWWALKLLVTQDYDADAPRSPLGRVFGILLIVASLFVVSVFVANLTANMTLGALSDEVSVITDLDARRVGTTEGSTTSAYLGSRGVAHRTFDDLDALTDAFYRGRIDAVAFDGPVLAYHVETVADGRARLLDRVFQPEYYGFALPTGSTLREPINRTLLRFEEDGTYAAIQREWFGAVYADR